jgi:uncharacterized membrane protein YfcA
MTLLQAVRVSAMTAPALACLIAVFVFTAFVSVVTGGTSLITVPVMMQLGIDPHIAVATNMLTLVFLSLGDRWVKTYPAGFFLAVAVDARLSVYR